MKGQNGMVAGVVGPRRQDPPQSVARAQRSVNTGTEEGVSIRARPARQQRGARGAWNKANARAQNNHPGSSGAKADGSEVESKVVVGVWEGM